MRSAWQEGASSALQRRNLAQGWTGGGGWVSRSHQDPSTRTSSWGKGVGQGRDDDFAGARGRMKERTEALKREKEGNYQTALAAEKENAQRRAIQARALSLL